MPETFGPEPVGGFGAAALPDLSATGDTGAVGENVNTGNVEPRTPDDLAVRVRSWYLEAMAHPLWKEWIPQAAEDMEFYVGGKGQWGKNGNYEDYQRLIDLKRAAPSLNQIQSIIDVMSGYERSNRFDIKASPQGEDDVEDAQLMSWMLKFAQDAIDLPDTMSDQFEDGNIEGMNVIKLGVDYTGDEPVRGEISCDRLRPGTEVIWDPHWKRYNLQDVRYVLEFRWAALADLIAQYDEHADELRDAVNTIETAFQRSVEASTSRPPTDAYGYVRRHPIENLDQERQFYDEDEQRLLIIEAWYRVYLTSWTVWDKQTMQMTDVESRAAGQALVATDPTRLELHRKESRRFRMGTVIPATYTVIEEDKNPHPNDDANHPYIAYIAKRKGHHVYGAVRNLKDPQRIENKRWAQVVDYLAKWGTIRPLIPKGSVVNPETLNDANATSPVQYDPEKGVPGWWMAPLAEMAKVLEQIALQMKVAIREISGINTDLLGLKQDTASGVAIARRQQQGQIVATVFFDNFRKTRRFAGQRLARRIQQVYTAKDELLLTNDVGETVPVVLNPPEGKNLSGDDWRLWIQKHHGMGKKRILRDVSSLKYEVLISESPSTPTARAATLMALLEIAEKIPQVAPAILDIIMKYADIADRTEVMQRVRRIMDPRILGEQAPQPPNPMATPGGPASAPPPGSPAPAQPATPPPAAPPTGPAA